MLAQQLVDIYKRLWLETMPSSELGITRDDIKEYLNDDKDKVTEWRDRILVHPSRTVWVLFTESNEAVGFSIATKAPRNNWVSFIFILSEYQGQGYGKALMQECLEWLGNEKPISLAVAKHNSKAIRLYNKLGFEVSPKPRPAKVLKNGKQIPWILMVRQ